MGSFLPLIVVEGVERGLTGPLVRYKTECSFTTEDPWNENRRATFTLEAYRLPPKGSQPKQVIKFGSEKYYYGIRSEVDGVDRMLPESLAYVWRNDQVQAEKLPRLLHEMGSMLKAADYRFFLLSKESGRIIHIVSGLWLLVTALLILFPTFFSSFFLFVVLYPFLIYPLFYRPRARRRRQVAWVLAHA